MVFFTPNFLAKIKYYLIKSKIMKFKNIPKYLGG